MTCAQTYFWALEAGTTFVGVNPVAVGLGDTVEEVEVELAVGLNVALTDREVDDTVEVAETEEETEAEP